jgi:hypothetical protein
MARIGARGWSVNFRGSEGRGARRQPDGLLIGRITNRTDGSMTSATPSWRSNRARLVAAALAACATAPLAGCGAMIGDTLPAAVGGLPAEAPARATPAAYPAVHNMPPSRNTEPLSTDQQKQLEDDLVATRNRYGGNPDAPAATGTTGTTGSTGTTANPKAGAARNP